MYRASSSLEDLNSKFGIKDSVQFEKNEEGLTKAVLTHSNGGWAPALPSPPATRLVPRLQRTLHGEPYLPCLHSRSLTRTLRNPSFPDPLKCSSSALM